LQLAKLQNLAPIKIRKNETMQQKFPKTTKNDDSQSGENDATRGQGAKVCSRPTSTLARLTPYQSRFILRFVAEDARSERGQ
jgi:hypothetical protein